nr:GNAT family N-acetyltransferase [Nakamurella flavida]
MARQRRKEITSGAARHYLAELDGEVIGIAIAGPNRDEGPAAEQELYAIYVRSAEQGSGVAGTLLAAALGDEPASLWVYRDNPRASAFYVHNGFIPDGGERTDSVGILEIRMVRR